MKSIYSIVFISLTTFILSCSEKPQLKKADIASDSILVDTIGITIPCLDELHKKKNFKTYDKSLVEYIKSKPNKPDSIRKIIYLLPLGNMSAANEKLLTAEVEYLQLFFQLPVKIMNRIPFDDIKKIDSVKTRLVPSEDYDYYEKKKGGYPVNLKEQIEAKSLIEHYIIENKPKDAIAILGITEHDIYVPSMNFIYGTSYLKNGVGLISTYRITDYPEESKNNIRKVVTKQIVNLFSIPNVKDYTCVLNFHNNIDELQNGVKYISPRTLEKLKFSIGFDYTKRFTELKDFAKKEGDTEMQAYYDKCLKLKCLDKRSSTGTNIPKAQ